YGKVAPATCRIRSIERLLDILGIRSQCEFFSVMAPQWNLRIHDAALRQAVIGHLQAARYRPLDLPMYALTESNGCVVLTPVSRPGFASSTRCVFPTLDGAPSFPLAELVMQEDDTRKSGCHDPVGMLALYGPPIRKGCSLGETNTLDITPTLLTLMGVQ